MARKPDFPPLYTPVRHAGADAYPAAIAAARGGADPATLFWSDRADAAECAIVLRPDGSVRHPLLAAYVAMNAAGDALAALLPPEMPLEFEWPDRILINSGVVGGTRLAAAPTAKAGDDPDWIVAGLLLAVEADPADEPGTHPDVTTFGDELSADDMVAVPDILEAYARSFLHWMARWQDDGFAPVARAWLDRSLGRHGAVFGRRHFFTVRGIDDDGTVVLEDGGTTRVLTLEQGIKRQSWWLPDRFGGMYKPEE